MTVQPQSVASQLAQVDSLLDSFIPSRQYVPADARRLRLTDELPLRLQLCAKQARNAVWRAWTDGLRIWFVVAKLMPGVSVEVNRRALRALQVSFFDIDGRLASCAAWKLSGGGRWTLYDAHPQSQYVSSDCAPSSVVRL